MQNHHSRPDIYLLLYFLYYSKKQVQKVKQKKQNSLEEWPRLPKKATTNY